MSKNNNKKDKKLITAEDLFALKQITEVTIRPTTNEIYFVINQANKEDNGYRNTIWRFKDESKQFSQGLPNDSSMKWSPDGKTLAFVSVRSVLKKPSSGNSAEPPKPQIYLMSYDGGEAIQLTKMVNGVMPFFEWSLDGSKIIFISRLNEDELVAPSPEDMKETDLDEVILQKMRVKKQEEKKIEPRIITREVYRTGTSFFDDRIGQIHVIDLETKKVDRWTNSKEDDYTFAFLSPDNSFAFSARRKPGEGDECRLWEFVKITPEGEVEVLVKDHFGWGAFCRPSPDGKHLASTVGNEELGTMAQSELCVYDVKTGECKIVAKELDNEKFLPKWSKDGKYLYFMIFDEAKAEIWRAKTETWKVKKIISGDKGIADYEISDDNKIIAYHAFYVNDPSQLYKYDLTTKEDQLIFEPNKEFLEKKNLGKTEEVWFDGCNNDFKIQGWILTPHDFDPKKKYPLALNMHGGPHVMWSNHQSIPMFHEFQLLAAEGYVVFYCNPRGSSGYGQEFYKAIEKSWGDKDSIDILNGVDKVIKRGYIDTDRMAITGGSYAGFMTAWIIGHDTRFAAAVAQRGVYYLSSFWATTDWARILIDDEFGTTPLIDQKFLWERSPAAYAKNIKTPLRIIHSEIDYRAPIPDAEMLYLAIKREVPDLEIEFLRYPGEGHELSRSGQPNRRIDRLFKIVEWFDKYCQPAKIKKQEEKDEKIKEIKESYKQKIQEEIKKLEG